MDEGKAIYGNDGTSGGGTSIFKTNKTLLIIVFKGDPVQSNRAGQEFADQLMEAGS